VEKMAQIKTRELNTEEVIEILENIPQNDVRFALWLEALMGFRISDTMTLTKEKLKYNNIMLKEKKTGKENRRELTAEQREEILDYMLKYDIKFDSSIETFSRKCQRAIKSACEKIGLDSSNISTHSFRKYYATTVYSDSKDILLVSKLLNHSNVAITQRYLGIDKESLKKYSCLNTIKIK